MKPKKNEKPVIEEDEIEEEEEVMESEGSDEGEEEEEGTTSTVYKVREKRKSKSIKSMHKDDMDDIRELVEPPRRTVDSALAQLKREEAALREFMDDLKSKERHLRVEEERVRYALNQRL